MALVEALGNVLGEKVEIHRRLLLVCEEGVHVGYLDLLLVLLELLDQFLVEGLEFLVFLLLVLDFRQQGLLLDFELLHRLLIESHFLLLELVLLSLQSLSLFGHLLALLLALQELF